VAGNRFRVRIGEQVAEFTREGVYRFDASPARFRVHSGEMQLSGARILRGQEAVETGRREFNRRERDPLLYFAAYRSLQLEAESGSFRQWRASFMLGRAHSGFGIDFPETGGAARLKYLVGGEAGLVYHLEGNATTGGRTPLSASRLPFRMGPGGDIRTRQGRAEVFLGVGLIARLAADTHLRVMDTTALHPLIALEQGSASIEVTRSSDEPRLRVRVGDSITELVKPGVYRFDAAAQSLEIYGGEAEINVSDHVVRGRQSQQVSLRESGRTMKFDPSRGDAFMKWTAERSFALYQSPAAFMTAWEPMTERGKVRHKFFGERFDPRPQPRRRPRI
jgi:hypothetical protein